MTTATNTEHRLELPNFSYHSLTPATTAHELESLSLYWEEGISTTDNTSHNIEDIPPEERIALLPDVEISNTGLFDMDAYDRALEATKKMSQPTSVPTQESSKINLETGLLSPQIERTYLHCYTAASVALLCLSATSFVIPSISTYPPEHAAVQTLGYTGGVIALLSGIAAGASVISAYTGSGYLHR